MFEEHDPPRVPFTYEYPRPAVTVDVVIFTMREEDLAVLLIKRCGQPYKGQWALPGGFVEKDESLEKAAARELQEETGLQNVPFEQLAAFGTPGRDPRGHTVSVVFFTFVVAESALITAGDDAADAAWHPLRRLALDGDTSRARPLKLAFDHALIIAKARRRLQERLSDPTRESAFQLVPPIFTLTELQRVYEAVLGQSLDKRNFRSRLIARGIVSPLAARRTGKHRPAQLYRWKIGTRTR